MKRLQYSIMFIIALVLMAACSTPASEPPTTEAPTNAPAPTTAPAAQAPLAWQPCTDPLPAELECAQMQVPMDYADPTGPTITLGLTRLQATDPASRIGSLIINPGGPGSSAVDILMAQVLANFPFTPKLRQYFDIVGFDPRGVGLSTPVKCDPALWNASESLFPRDQAAYDAMVANNTAFGQSCLEKTGPVLAHLDTVAVARDLDAVRVALGDAKLNYFGLSYGTMIGAQYAELFPQNIRVMALDGALDHSQSENTFHFVETKAYEQVLEGFAAWCAATETCALYGRDVLAEFDALVKQADATPIAAPACAASGACRATVTGDDLRSNLQEKLVGFADWPTLAENLAAALNGDASEFAFQIKQTESDTAFSETAIQCLDWTAETNATFEGFQARRLLAVAMVPHTQGAAQSWRAQTRCLGWPVPPTNPPRPLKVEGAPPILIVNATYDPSTSMQWALEMYHQLPSAVLLIRQGFGHTSYAILGENPVRDLIDEYLITGNTPPPNTVLPN